VNGGLVQGVEPSSPPRNRGRRRSRGRNRRREVRVVRGGCHRGERSQARSGVTRAHEGEAVASLAAREALGPRQRASAADAKWPLSMEGAHGRGKPLPVTRGWWKRSRQLSPGRAHAKAWTPPTENRSERSDTGVRGRPHRPRGEQHAPPRCKEAPHGVDAARRSEGNEKGHVMAPFPGHVVGPKTRRSARRASAGDAPGTPEYGCT